LKGNTIKIIHIIIIQTQLTRFLRQKSYKIQGFSRPFHAIIQGQFNALLPVNHSIAYSPTDTQEKQTHRLKHWCVVFISTRSSADADKPARHVCRSVTVTKHSTIVKLLKITNRKPYIIYGMISLSVTFDPNFKVTTFLKNIVETVRLKDKGTIAQ